MCGRFTLRSTKAVYKRFQVSNRLDSLVPCYPIAAGQMVPVPGRGSPCLLSIGPATLTRAPRRRTDPAAGVYPRQTRQRGSSAEHHWLSGRGVARQISPVTSLLSVSHHDPHFIITIRRLDDASSLNVPEYRIHMKRPNEDFEGMKIADLLAV
jgi:hypothetical protein